MESFRELRFDRVHGDAEFFGDFTVGEVFKFAEDEDFTAARRQLRDRRREQVGLLLAAGGLGGVGRSVEDARGDKFRYRNRVRGGAAAEEVAGGVAGGGEEEAARMLDRAAFMSAKEAGVGFLHEVVDVGGGDETVEIGAEGGLVGRELDGEPLRRVGLGRNHCRTFGAAATVASPEMFCAGNFGRARWCHGLTRTSATVAFRPCVCPCCDLSVLPALS